jgi:hypothetical protein
MGARLSALTIPVEQRTAVEFRAYQGRTPVLSVQAGRMLVSLTMPTRLGAEHVEFARSLAEQAAAYAVEVERLYRGLPSTKTSKRKAA